jgi:Uma2 family endonuclease
MSSIAKTLLTADELEKWPDDDSVRIELDEGELIEMAPASEEHGGIENEIGSILRNFVKEQKLGKVYSSSAGFKLKPDTMRAPDVSFVRESRRSEVKSRGFGKGAPDLVVEIFSLSDSVRQLKRKIKQYFDAGTHTVWIVYPESREVNVIDASGADRVLGTGESIDCPELLPGFSVKIDEFFES